MNMILSKVELISNPYVIVNNQDDLLAYEFKVAVIRLLFEFNQANLVTLYDQKYKVVMRENDFAYSMIITSEIFSQLIDRNFTCNKSSINIIKDLQIQINRFIISLKINLNKRIINGTSYNLGMEVFNSKAVTSNEAKNNLLNCEEYDILDSMSKYEVLKILFSHFSTGLELFLEGEFEVKNAFCRCIHNMHHGIYRNENNDNKFIKYTDGRYLEISYDSISAMISHINIDSNILYILINNQTFKNAAVIFCTEVAYMLTMFSDKISAVNNESDEGLKHRLESKLICGLSIRFAHKHRVSSIIDDCIRKINILTQKYVLDLSKVYFRIISDACLENMISSITSAMDIPVTSLSIKIEKLFAFLYNKFEKFTIKKICEGINNEKQAMNKKIYIYIRK